MTDIVHIASGHVFYCKNSHRSGVGIEEPQGSIPFDPSGLWDRLFFHEAALTGELFRYRGAFALNVDYSADEVALPAADDSGQLGITRPLAIGVHLNPPEPLAPLLVEEPIIIGITLGKPDAPAPLKTIERGRANFDKVRASLIGRFFDQVLHPTQEGFDGANFPVMEEWRANVNARREARGQSVLTATQLVDPLAGGGLAALDGELGSSPAREAWIRLTVIHQNREQTSMGAVGRRRYTITGQILASIFVPLDLWQDKNASGADYSATDRKDAVYFADEMGDAFVKIYDHARPLTRDNLRVRCGTSAVVEQPVDSRGPPARHIVIVTPFQYDERA